MDSWEASTIRPAWDRLQKSLFILQACFCIYKLFGREIWDSRNVEVSILMHSADREIFSCLISIHICSFSMSLTIQFLKPTFLGVQKKMSKTTVMLGFE